MPPSKAANAFRQYCYTWDPKTVRCPTCFERLTFKDYRTRHCVEAHSRSSKFECVFCDVGIKWKRGEKLSHLVSSHLLQCVKRFTKTQKMEERAVDRLKEFSPPAPPLPCSECLEFDSSDHRRCLYGREMVPHLVQKGFYDDPFPDFFNDSTGVVAFDKESGLGTTAPFLMKLLLEKRWKFYHVLLKSFAYETFLVQMQRLGDKVKIAPFWCLCDGYTIGEVGCLHKHMIVLTSDARAFGSAWNRVVVKNNLRERCRSSRRIENLFHLASVITYVSSRRATCDGHRTNLYWEEGQDYHHFFINRPVSPHAIVSLCALFPTGLNSWVTRKVGSCNVDAWDYAKVRDAKGNVHYKTPTSQLKLTVRGCPAPLAPGFEMATDSESGYELHLMNGARMPLRFDPDSPVESRAERFARRVASGNAFVECIESFPYRFTKTQAAQAGAIDRVKENMHLETIRKVEEIRLSSQEKLDGERVSWQEKLDGERVSWQERVDDLTKRLEETEKELLSAEWRLKLEQCEAEN